MSHLVTTTLWLLCCAIAIIPSFEEISNWRGKDPNEGYKPKNETAGVWLGSTREKIAIESLPGPKELSLRFEITRRLFWGYLRKANA